MTTALYIILIAGIAVALFLVFRKKKKQVPPTSAPGIVIPANLIGHPRTDGGMWLTVSQVPVELRPIVGQAIIDGLTEMIAAVRYAKPSWTRFLNTADYQVIFIPPMATNQDGSPALLVAGIQTAGTVINVGTGYENSPEPPILILPEQAMWDFLEYLKTSVHNEGEHAVLWMNDQPLFYFYTNANDVHPIFPPPPGAAA